MTPPPPLLPHYEVKCVLLLVCGSFLISFYRCQTPVNSLQTAVCVLCNQNNVGAGATGITLWLKQAPLCLVTVHFSKSSTPPVMTQRCVIISSLWSFIIIWIVTDVKQKPRILFSCLFLRLHHVLKVMKNKSEWKNIFISLFFTGRNNYLIIMNVYVKRSDSKRRNNEKHLYNIDL